MEDKRIILKYRKGVDPDGIVGNTLRGLLVSLGLKESNPLFSFDMERSFSTEDISVSSWREILKNTYLLKFKETVNIDSIISFLHENHANEIEYVEVDQEILFFKNPIDTSLTFSKTSGDPLRTINYSPVRMGQKKVVLAIIDSGVNYHHQFLKSSLWSFQNTKKSYGLNFTDSNNGDLYDVLDDDGHGSMLAGIIGATDNKQVQGIAPEIQILSLKVYPSRGDRYFASDICKALLIANAMGASVINNSWRFLDSQIPKSNIIEQVLQLLYNNNCIPIFAAGNSNDDCNLFYPQRLKNIINVGAIDNNLKKYEHSNWGDNVTVWAPGVSIWSTYKSGVQALGNSSGTSYATPFVSAVVGILKSKHPEMNLDEVKKRLQIDELEIVSGFMKGYVLNYEKTLSNQINQKSRIMSTTNFPTPPNDRADINKDIAPFCHLDRSDIFQLLHSEVDLSGSNSFQIFGCFKGEKIDVQGQPKFLLQTAAFKLVNINPNKPPLKMIDSISFKHNPSKNRIDVEISTKTVAQPHSEIDKEIEELFLIDHLVKMDFHVDGKLDRNGLPCNVLAFF